MYVPLFSILVLLLSKCFCTSINEDGTCYAFPTSLAFLVSLVTIPNLVLVNLDAPEVIKERDVLFKLSTFQQFSFKIWPFRKLRTFCSYRKCSPLAFVHNVKEAWCVSLRHESRSSRRISPPSTYPWPGRFLLGPRILCRWFPTTGVILVYCVKRPLVLLLTRTGFVNEVNKRAYFLRCDWGPGSRSAFYLFQWTLGIPSPHRSWVGRANNPIKSPWSIEEKDTMDTRRRSATIHGC